MEMNDAALVALEQAIRFESDGRDYYLAASAQAKNPLAAKLFLALADEEKDHVRRVREIYEELKDKPGWPSMTEMVARQAGVLDVFQKAPPASMAADADEHAALTRAAEMERKGIGFYRDRLAQASCAAEAAFYKRLVAEEEQHLRAVEKALAALA
jgi:rubrerythrin